ncbi:MAG: hypothetical protein C0P79_012780 [Gammaproteobacteria bacterium]
MTEREAGETIDAVGETIDVDRVPVPRSAGSSSGAVVEYREPPPPANPFDANPDVFKQQIQVRGENYQSLVGWLVDNLVVGEDIVQTHFVKREKCEHGGPWPRGNCAPSIAPAHWSDPDISKKGAEKICGLLGLGTRFVGMSDFRRAALAGREIRDVVIDCELYTASGTAISQGTGASSVEEAGSLNNALKKAAKRAHLDAVKRCVGLSGLATELKRRLPPIDPDEAARAARQERARQQASGGNARWSTGRLPEKCPIGKHKGKPWRDVPSGSLEWIVANVTDKPDIREAASRELKRRAEEAFDDQNEAHEIDPDFNDDIPF